MENTPRIGCIIAASVVALLALAGALFWFHSASTTHHVDPGNYDIVVFYHSNGSQDTQVYAGGSQYTVEWGSNTKVFSYSSQVQSLKLFHSTSEGISPTHDDIGCHDSNGTGFSGDLQATFVVNKTDVPLVYSQHQDLPLNTAPGTNGVDSTIAGVVVRPVLILAWQTACESRTYLDFEQQEATSVAQDIMAFAAPRLKTAGITLASVLPQTVYLPPDLQNSINAVANAQAQNQASLLAVQAAKNQAAALEAIRQEIAKDPNLLRLLMLEDILAKWNGTGQVPQIISTFGG